MPDSADASNDRRWAWVFTFAWLLALALPAAYEHPNKTGGMLGLFILFWGPLAALFFQFGWFANIGFYLCVKEVFGNKELSVSSPATGIVTLVLVVDAATWRKIPLGEVSVIDSFGPGYFLWIFAVAGAAILSISRSRRIKRLGTTHDL
jgi:hypothetical protein